MKITVDTPAETILERISTLADILYFQEERIISDIIEEAVEKSIPLLERANK